MESDKLSSRIWKVGHNKNVYTLYSPDGELVIM